MQINDVEINNKISDVEENRFHLKNLLSSANLVANPQILNIK